MIERTEQETLAINSFLTPYFGEGFVPEEVSDEEVAIMAQVLAFVEARFDQAKYPLGMMMDFALLAQGLSQVDAEAKSFRDELDGSKLFERYERITKRGERIANTLTLRFNGSEVGIRKTEEEVVNLFHALNRTGYPSSYVYMTGVWDNYQNLLVQCFQLSESGRFTLVQRLIDFGLAKMPVNELRSRAVNHPRLFESLITTYRRGVPPENGGVVFQAIAFGFFHADRPHLSLVTDKVRSGSARQRRIGDVDGYRGLDLEITVEVKDLVITGRNVERQCGKFLASVKAEQLPGMVLALTFDDEARKILADTKVRPVTEDDLIGTIGLWDWPKQNEALNGVLHYLAHIEQDPVAVERLLGFIRERDPRHESLPPDQEGSVALP
jgi:hypothetical protein